MQLKYTTPENVSNRVTRLLNISLKEPGVATLEREIRDFPQKREQEIVALKAELDNKYNETVKNNNLRISEKKSKLASAEYGHASEKERKQDTIQSISENISRMRKKIESMQVQIEKDTTAIRWLTVWRVFWGIIATALLFGFILFFVVRGIFWLIGLFMPKSDDDD